MQQLYRVALAWLAFFFVLCNCTILRVHGAQAQTVLDINQQTEKIKFQNQSSEVVLFDFKFNETSDYYFEKLDQRLSISNKEDRNAETFFHFDSNSLLLSFVAPHLELYSRNINTIIHISKETQAVIDLQKELLKFTSEILPNYCTAYDMGIHTITICYTNDDAEHSTISPRAACVFTTMLNSLELDDCDCGEDSYTATAATITVTGVIKAGTITLTAGTNIILMPGSVLRATTVTIVASGGNPAVDLRSGSIIEYTERLSITGNSATGVGMKIFNSKFIATGTSTTYLKGVTTAAGERGFILRLEKEPVTLSNVEIYAEAVNVEAINIKVDNTLTIKGVSSITGINDGVAFHGNTKLFVVDSPSFTITGNGVFGVLIRNDMNVTHSSVRIVGTTTTIGVFGTRPGILLLKPGNLPEILQLTINDSTVTFSGTCSIESQPALAANGTVFERSTITVDGSSTLLIEGSSVNMESGVGTRLVEVVTVFDELSSVSITGRCETTPNMAIDPRAIVTALEIYDSTIAQADLYGEVSSDNCNVAIAVDLSGTSLDSCTVTGNLDNCVVGDMAIGIYVHSTISLAYCELHSDLILSTEAPFNVAAVQMAGSIETMEETQIYVEASGVQEIVGILFIGIDGVIRALTVNSSVTNSPSSFGMKIEQTIEEETLLFDIDINSFGETGFYANGLSCEGIMGTINGSSSTGKGIELDSCSFADSSSLSLFGSSSTDAGIYIFDTTFDLPAEGVCFLYFEGLGATIDDVDQDVVIPGDFTLDLHTNCDFVNANGIIVSGDFNILGSTVPSTSTEFRGAIQVSNTFSVLTGNAIFSTGPVSASTIIIDSTENTICGEFTATTIEILAPSEVCETSEGNPLSLNAATSIEIGPLDGINSDVFLTSSEIILKGGGDSSLATLTVQAVVRIRIFSQNIITETSQTYTAPIIINSIGTGGPLAPALPQEILLKSNSLAETSKIIVNGNFQSNDLVEISGNSVLDFVYSFDGKLTRGIHQLSGTLTGIIELESTLVGGGFIDTLDITVKGTEINPSLSEVLQIGQLNLLSSPSLKITLSSPIAFSSVTFDSISNPNSLNNIKLSIEEVGGFQANNGVTFFVAQSDDNFQSVDFIDVQGNVLEDSSEIFSESDGRYIVSFPATIAKIPANGWLSLRREIPSVSRSPTRSPTTTPSSSDITSFSSTVTPSLSITGSISLVLPSESISVSLTPRPTSSSSSLVFAPPLPASASRIVNSSGVKASPSKQQVVENLKSPTIIPSVSISIAVSQSNLLCIGTQGSCSGQGGKVEAILPATAPSGASIVLGPTDTDLIGQSDISTVNSIILNVELADQSQELGGSVEICIEAENQNNSEDFCLGFLNESFNPPTWECEDKCIQEISDGLYCGSTNHFTNFALLLNGAGGSGNDCEDSDEDFIFAWLSIGGVGIAVVIIFLFVILIEFRYKMKRRNLRKTLHYLETVDAPDL